MTTHVDTRGRRFVTCSNCGTQSPHRKGGRAARAAAKEAGWARSYPHGFGEDFYCPKCRAR